MKQFYKYLVIVFATLYIGIFGVKIASSYFPFYQGQLGTGTATTGYVLTSTGTGANTVAQWSATLPALTSGSVLFSNGSTIAQDNANFFWDSTNHRLGIGTTSPGQALEVNGEIVQDAYTTSGTNAYGLAVNAPTGATHNYTAIFSGGNVGIGTTTPGEKLEIGPGGKIGRASCRERVCLYV